MLSDESLSELDFIADAVAEKLRDFEIHTILQLAERLRSAGQSRIQHMLALSDDEFRDLYRNVVQFVEQEFPEDQICRDTVHKHGVAVHRLNDPSRPKYFEEDRG